MDFSKLQVVRVLNRDAQRHNLFLGCSVPGSEKLAIVQVAAAVPSKDSLSHIQAVEQLEDDKYALQLSGGSVNVTVMHPGAKQFYLRNLESPYYYFEETPELYDTVTKPWIEQIPPSMLQWVYNLLDHISETEELFYEDPDPELGFSLVPDLKFKNYSAESFYFSVVLRRRDLKSIRDLRATHLDMLKRLELKVTEAISSRLGVAARHVQLFFHYWPSFYHLHLHATNLNFSNELPRGRSLTQVMHNLERDSEYYKKASLTISISTTHANFPSFARHYGVEIPQKPDMEAELARLE
mmetsp:Transcript_16821/g.30070  ORF Transcript_16821/g.30070 Transcript_16821/m.30070 type:complete len:296 (-) Transcript_16821:21686-22573(-)